MPQPSITKTHLKITYLKFYSTFPGANELTDVFLAMFCSARAPMDKNHMVIFFHIDCRLHFIAVIDPEHDDCALFGKKVLYTASM